MLWFKIIPEKIILSGLIIYCISVTTSTSAQVFGIILGIFGLIPMLFLEHKNLKKIPFNIPILFFIISLVISSLLSQSPMESLDKTESIIRKILVYYLVIVGISDIKWAKRLIYILLISTGISAIYIFLQYAFEIKIFTIHWAASKKLLGYNRSLGGVLGMIFPISLCLSLFPKSLFFKIAFGINSIILLVLLFLTSTRGAWLGVAVGIIFIGILKDKRILLLFLPIIGFGFLFPSNLVKNRVIQTFNINYFPNSERVYIWKESLKKIKDNPIFGIGPGSFKATQGADTQLHSHNNLLNVGVSGGLISLALFIWLIISIFIYSFKAIKDNDNPLKLGFFASLIDWFIHGLVDTTYLGKCGYLFWFLVGIFAVLQKESKKNEAT